MLTEAYGPIVETLDAFAKNFGRQYLPVESYRADDAEVLLLTMGALGETAMTAVDRRRDQGDKIGLVRLRLWRPFPFADLIQAVGKVPVLGVMDRAISPGGPSPVASEVKAAFYHQQQRPQVVEFTVGLGGRDTPLSDFDGMFDTLLAVHRGGEIPKPTIIGLRE